MSDKTAHVIAYALLGAVVLRARSDLRWAGCTWRAAWQSWLVATGYGVTDELHQWFVPGRMSSAADWVADAVGAAAAVVAIVVLAIAMGRQRRAV
jgi:VanZ family protein